MQYIMIIIYFD